jgi:Ca-activated chloride channel family protein
VEGTFWSDHPYSVLDAPWVGAEEKDAGQKLYAFLKERPQQERALALGFRPADPAVHVAAPIDASHGADPKQPQALLELPDAETMDALIDVWRETKKTADVVLVFDKSGSMMGKPLAEAKAGADAFLDVLGDRDDVSIVFFDNTIYPEFGPLRLATSRPVLKQRIDGAIAGGGPALYEVVLETQKLALMRAQKEPDRIHAVVVMTDGKDESSKIGLGEVVRGLKTEDGSAPVKMFTIAYGQQAEGKVLDQIAEAAQGTSSKGNVETIVQVYRDMASFF